MKKSRTPLTKCLQSQTNLAGIAYKRTYLECQAIRARVKLRRSGDMPVDPSEIEKTVRHQININKGTKYPITILSEEDVQNAFKRGEEVTINIDNSSAIRKLIV